jgi:hypothetical protein
MSKLPALLPRDPHAWLTKAAAAARLRCSIRTIERHISEGRLRSRSENVAGRKPAVLVDPAGLAALLAAADPASSLVASPRALPAAPAAAMPGPQLGQLLDRIARAIAESKPAAPGPLKPWLDLDEAAEYSGLPRAWLLSQARGGSGVAINVAMGGGDRWRFSRRRLAGLRRSGPGLGRASVRSS